MEEASAAADSIVTGLVDRIKGSARVEVVYGERQEIGDKTIIPIAVVAYGFGAGSGSGPRQLPGEDGSTGTGSGGGGGGGVRVQPVGVLEVTAEDTRVVPVFDWTRIITTALTFLGIWMIIRALRGRRK